MTRQVSSNLYERWIVVSTLFFITVFAFALSSSPAWAQATATLNGTVHDSAGAVVTEATVVLHNRDTNLDRTAATNSVGAYVMPDVQPGNYDLKVSKPGFGPSIKSGITLVVNQTATYDFALKAGAVNEVVNVQANSIALETSTAELGVAVVKEQVNDLPLNGRNFTQLLNLTPGVSTVNVSQNSAPAAAVACLEDAIKQAMPADQSELVQAALAIACAENGEMERALATLKGLVAAQPASSNAHFNLGLLYARKGQFQDQQAAVTEFREALRLDKDLDTARIALGQVLVSQQKYSDTVSVLLEYTRHQPKDAQGFYALGLAYQGLKKSDAAVSALQRAIVLDPRDPAVRFRLGMLLASTGQTDAAIHQLEAAERINPADLETHNALALLLEKSGYKERARVEKVKVDTLKSSGEKEAAIASLYQEASQYLSAGNAKAAAEGYRNALQLNPRDPKLHFNLSLALDKMGDFSSERKELERTLQLDPGVAVAQNQLGLLALRSGQQEEAERCFTKALAIDPKFAEAQSSLGVLYSQQGNNEEAASLFQKAIKNDPKYTKAYVNLGLLMAQRGAFLEAEHQFRTAIEVDSNYPDAYAALGMVQAKTGHGAEAVKNFQQAVMLEPASAQAHLNLGIALVDQFDRPGGFKEFSEAARLNPKLAAAHFNLGRFFFETGKYEDADQEHCSIGERETSPRQKRSCVPALELAPNDTDAQNALAVLEDAHRERVK